MSQSGPGWLLLAVCGFSFSCDAKRAATTDGGINTDSGNPVTRVAGFEVTQSPSLQSVGIRIACSSGGDALAYYVAEDGGEVRRYHAGTWQPPVALPATGGQTPLLAEMLRTVEMSADGSGTFAWTMTDSAAGHETANLYVDTLGPSNVWAGPKVVGDGGIGWWQEPTPPIPILGMGDAGATLVVWSRIDQVATWPSAVWSSHVGADGTWQVDGSIDVPSGTWATAPGLVVREHDDAVAAWQWFDGTHARVVVARRLGSTWQAPAVVEEAGSDVRFEVALAGGRSGPLTLVYRRSNASMMSDLLVRRSADGQTWTDPELLAALGTASFQMVHNRAGGAVVIWSEILMPSAPTMRILVPGSNAWTQPMSPLPGPAPARLIAQHRDGGVAMLYRPLEQTGDVILRRYSPPSGWQDPQRIEASGVGVTGLCFAGDDLVAAWRRSTNPDAAVGVFR